MTEKTSIAAGLQALASTDESRSMAARLRDVFDDVEAALNKGVSRTAVLKVLQSHGIEFTLSGFDSTLRRIRIERSGRPATSSSQAAPTREPRPTVGAAKPETVETDRHEPSQGSHDPAALDSILKSPPDLAALAKLGSKREKK